MANIRGSNRSEVLVGTRLDDTIVGRGGNDYLRGLAGDDVLRGGLGADRLDGGAGNDWADYRDAAVGVTANLTDRTQNTGEAAGDRYTSIERLRGSAFDDTLVGNAGANVLEGLAGADVLDGRDGFDFARYKGATAGVTVNLDDPSSNTGDAAGDTFISIEGLQGSNFNDDLTGDGNDNVLIGGAGADVLNGGGGFDFARYEIGDITTGVIANLADSSLNTGDAAGDVYAAIEGLIGTRFSDRLTGAADDNILRGLGGNDRLDGGLGNDTLNGGGGRDAYVFSTALDGTNNVDTIQGFSVRDDVMRLDTAIFLDAGGAGTLARGRFHIGAAAGDGTDRIIYNRATGALYYDSDGTGAEAQVQFAQLAAKLALTNKDFVLF